MLLLQNNLHITTTILYYISRFIAAYSIHLIFSTDYELDLVQKRLAQKARNFIRKFIRINNIIV